MATAGLLTQNANFGVGPKNCTFPFRYRDVLYYACTDLEKEGLGPFRICATSTDYDFNAIELGVCDTVNRCPIQRTLKLKIS